MGFFSISLRQRSTLERSGSGSWRLSPGCRLQLSERQPVLDPRVGHGVDLGVFPCGVRLWSCKVGVFSQTSITIIIDNLGEVTIEVLIALLTWTRKPSQAPTEEHQHVQLTFVFLENIVNSTTSLDLLVKLAIAKTYYWKFLNCSENIVVSNKAQRDSVGIKTDFTSKTKETLNSQLFS